MKIMLLLLSLFSLTFMNCNSEDNVSKTDDLKITGKDLAYDEELAVQLGADEYGMKKYVFAFLKAGPNRDQDSLTAAKLQQAHLENIQKLTDQGKLVLAGPFLDGGELRGIYIFNVATIEEARRLTNTDPAIKAGRLTMELHPWYGSAILQQLYQLHKAVAKKTF